MSDQSHIDPAIINFVELHGFSAETLTPLTGDASSRRYMRVRNNNAKAILMIAPPNSETATCPPSADEDKRRKLGYNATARLAGSNLHAFIEISNVLRGVGLSAPEIYAAEYKLGLALTEDFGDELFAKAVNSANETLLYELAVSGISHLHKSIWTAPCPETYTIQTYDALAYQAEAALFMEWYWPLIHSTEAPGELVDEYNAIFEMIFSELEKPSALVLRDYHAENLIFLADRQGLGQLGLIDFQDALTGSRAYDLVSLLEDARRDVPIELQNLMVEKYCADMAGEAGFSSDQYKAEYAILALQRNAKILGVFARLAKRDGKMRYLDLLPRVEAHFRHDLERTQAIQLKSFMSKHFPDKF